MLRLITTKTLARANYALNVSSGKIFNHNIRANSHVLHVTRNFSDRNFMKSFLDKLKEESEKDKSMKESIRKFREETEKLEKSQELQNIRDFYKKIEKDLPTDSFEKIKGQLDTVMKRIQEDENIKKSFEQIKKAGSQIADTTKQISEAEIFKNTAEAIDKELVSDRAHVYRSPKELKTRAELAGKFKERVVEANEEAQGMVLHKDSKWFAAWQDFKDNNKMAQKFFDFQTKIDETDHPVFNSMRYVKDKFSSLFGGASSSNELQTVLDEIAKMDPSFSLDGFLKFCRFDVIPNVLEAIIRGDLEILKDWCHEAPYSVLSTPLKQAKEMGLILDNHILDVNNVDLQLGKMMEHGPMLLITFQTQQISCLRDAKTGEVKEGDPSKVLRIAHVWALCRDQNELHPYSSWRILEIGMMPTDQWI